MAIRHALLSGRSRFPVLGQPRTGLGGLKQFVGRCLALGSSRPRQVTPIRRGWSQAGPQDAVLELARVELQIRICLNSFIRAGSDHQAVQDVTASLDCLGRVLGLGDINRLAAMGDTSHPDQRQAVFRLALAVLASRGRPDDAEILRASASGIGRRQMDEINSTVVTTVLGRHLQQVGSISSLVAE